MNKKHPMSLLKFVCKTGFISKNLWEKYFFERGHVSWKNRSWRLLESRKYLRPYPNKRCEDIFVLNEEGIRSHAIRLPQKVNSPMISHLEHDELLYEGLLRLEKCGLVQEWKSEGELKLFSPEDYRIETQGQLIKYPDALIFFRDLEYSYGVAVEMERTQKSKKRYIQIMSSYANIKSIDAIVWVTDSVNIERHILSAMKIVGFPFSKIFVGFVREEKWLTRADESLEKLNIILEKRKPPRSPIEA